MPNIRSATPAALAAKAASFFVRNIAIVVLLLAPADSTIGNRRYLSKRLRRGQPRRPPMATVFTTRRSERRMTRIVFRIGGRGIAAALALAAALLWWGGGRG